MDIIRSQDRKFILSFKISVHNVEVDAAELCKTAHLNWDSYDQTAFPVHVICTQSNN